MAGTCFRASFATFVALILAACSGAVTAIPSPAPDLTIIVNGQAHPVFPGTTFALLQSDLGLHASDGRLLSVSGETLDRHDSPGQITLNGGPAKKGQMLEAGDSIVVTPGLDRTEGTKRVVVKLAGQHPAVPQRTLATYPMNEISTVGRVSGEVARIEYRPIGKAKIPGEVALSFDDGPWPGQTEKVLKILKRFHVKATFFMVGSLVEDYPGIARRVVDAGMTVGNHTWSHPEYPGLDELKPHRLESELTKTSAVLRRVGVRPFLMRPPGGLYDKGAVQEARRLGLRTVTWSVDPSDWMASRTKKQLVKLVLSRVRPGSIVLMHDGGGDQSATIAALPQIIRGIRKMGLKLVAIHR